MDLIDDLYEEVGRTGSPETNEGKRILNLVRRPPLDLESPKAKKLTKEVNRRLRKKGVKSCLCASMGRECITSLKAIQAWTFYEASKYGGVAAPIGVGCGKTGLDILMASVLLEAGETCVLLVPSRLRKQLQREYVLWEQHWKVPSMIIDNDFGPVKKGMPVVHVISYEKLMRPESTELLESIKPKLILVDECHKLKNQDTATVARFERYLFKHRPKVCLWSGTMVSNSIKDAAHLVAHALGDGSPIPILDTVVDDWARSLDPEGFANPRMGRGRERGYPSALKKLRQPGESIREAFGRHLIHTPGWVFTSKSAVDCTLIIDERKAPPIPKKLRETIAEVRETGVRPDGEQFIDQLQTAKCLRELASGFYYRWIFPHGEPEELIKKWFLRRKRWNKELRTKLQSRRVHMDSEKLCKAAAERFEQKYKGDLPVWKTEHWAKWRDIEDKVKPESQAVWLDDYLAKDAAKWAKKNLGVVWYDHEAFGARVAELSGMPLHAGGPGAEAKILAEKGDRSIIASRNSHGTGRDGLQFIFNEQLVANPPSGGEAWEQTLGRLHREGQKADEVVTYVYRHTQEYRDAIDKALLKNEFSKETLTQEQKMLLAQTTF